MKDLRDLFDHARAYSKARPANPAAQFFDSRLEAMLPVVEGKIPLLVAADRADQIQSAVAFGVEQNVRVIIFGGYDAEACAELLRRYSVPVIIDAIHKDPRREHEDYDAAFTLPERLRQAGVKFCISGSGRSETWNTRNLPYQAATAAAYGLPYEDAMRSVTIWPAEILGIASMDSIFMTATFFSAEPGDWRYLAVVEAKVRNQSVKTVPSCERPED